MTVRLSAAIQHHPARPECLARLEADLKRERARYEVVTDPEPFGLANPWRCARLCWQQTPDWCTHRLVLQDDAMPCKGFWRAAKKAITHRPDDPVSFFVGHDSRFDMSGMFSAADRCAAWWPLNTRSWIPCIALALPKEMALSLGAFQARQEIIADDETVGDWCQHNGIHVVWQTIPSLVQHDEEAMSTVAGHRVAHFRHAACFIGDGDPKLIDWCRS